MCIDRQVVGGLAAEHGVRRAVLEEVAGHPVVLARAREILDGLAPVASVELGSALAGRANKYRREPRIERHRNERCFAITGNSFDANSLGVD